MTTIAYRNGVLASDSQVTGNGSLTGFMKKIGQTPDGRLVGATGNATYAHKVLAWAETAEGDPPVPGEDEGTALIVNLDGSLTHLQEGGVFNTTAPYFALGSGRELALGAMAAGAEAFGAVIAAMQHDIFTGGPVETLELNNFGLRPLGEDQG